MATHNLPRKAESGWPAAVVGGAYYTAINLMRNLSRHGVTTYCIDHGQNRQAFHTVYGKAFECPDPDAKPGAWLDFMLDLAKKVGGKPVLIPSADAFVSAMATHADTLAEAYIFCRDATALQGLLATKDRQYDVAAKHGMPVARTRYATTLEEVIDFGLGAVFPCVVKPVRSYDWAKVPRTHPLARSKVAVATSLEDLKEKYRTIAELNPGVVVQEMIEGPDTSRLIYLSCYSTDRRRIARCMVRTIRSAPINFGSSSVVEPVEDEETDSVCDRFLRSLGYAGLCEISLKRDSRDNRVKMVEANPRFTGISNAGICAGVDLGWVHYLDLTGQKVEMVTPSRRRFRHIALTWDVKTIGSYRRAGLLTWRDLIRSYWPPVEFFDLDLRDWRVAALTLWTVVYLLIGRPIRRFFSRKYAY